MGLGNLIGSENPLTGQKIFLSWREIGGVRMTGKQSLTWLQARIQEPVSYALTSLNRDAADSNAPCIPPGQASCKVERVVLCAQLLKIVDF